MQLSQFFVDNITQICLMAFAVNEISAGRITLGTYIGIRHYVSSCRSAGNVLVNFYNDFAKLQDSCERFFELMDRVPDVPLTGGALLAKVAPCLVARKRGCDTTPNQRQRRVCGGRRSPARSLACTHSSCCPPPSHFFLPLCMCV